MRRLPLLLALAVAVAACDEQPPDPETTVDVPEADVERFRAEIFQETLGIDADLARLEGEAAEADSVVRVGYEPVLERLRDDRRRLQVRLDTLAPQPPAFFDSTRAAVRAQTERLEEAVARGRYDAAPTYAALQAAVARGLADLDARLAAIRATAEEDLTGRRPRRVDSLAADRERFRARLGAYPDTLASQFPPFRATTTDSLLALLRRADVLGADTLRVAAPDSAAVAEPGDR